MAGHFPKESLAGLEGRHGRRRGHAALAGLRVICSSGCSLRAARLALCKAPPMVALQRQHRRQFLKVGPQRVSNSGDGQESVDPHEQQLPRAPLKAGFERRREASRGAMSTEQAHASGSTMMRMHKAHGDATMSDRAFAFQASLLLAPSAFQRKAQMLQDQLQMLLTRNPNKLGVGQAWVGDLISSTS